MNDPLFLLIISLLMITLICLLLGKMIPDGSLGYLNIGRDPDGKWRIWWTRD